eukprot:1837340-Pyramimonas_sp.AAC.1
MAAMRGRASTAPTRSMKRRFGGNPFCAPWTPSAAIGFARSLPIGAAILQSVLFKDNGHVALASR